MLYTCILEAEGGTYVSQVDAEDEFAAAMAWCEHFPTEDISGVDTQSMAGAVKSELAAFPPCALDGIAAVWYVHGLYKDVGLHMHIVRTAH